MTFDEWFHKEYEPADLQIKQYAERNEGLHIPATVYLEDLKKAFEAGLHTDVHTDNSKVIAELKAQIEKMKCCEMCKHKNLNWGFSPICEARDNINIENPLTCKCDKWEIKE